MATAKPNILINSISGRIGNVVFYTRHRAANGAITQCVRKHVIPRNPDTEAQRTVRLAFGDAVRTWQVMPADEQYTYTRKARHLNMSGYNLYISIYLKKIIRILANTPADEPKLKASSLTWNLELSALNLNPIPSVSKSYMLPYQLNRLYKAQKYGPG